MNLFVIMAASVLFVAACGRADHITALPSQAVVLEECNTGFRTGRVCNRAQTAEAHRTHKEAEKVFRNMTEGR